MEAADTKQVIICVSHLKWTDSLFQRPQQVMERLSHTHTVLFSYPLAFREWSGMLLRGGGARARLAKSRTLTVFRHRALLPVLRGRLRRFEAFNDWDFIRAVRGAVRGVPAHRRVLWFYYPKYLELIDALRPAAVVYDCMDNYTALFAGRDDPAHAGALAALRSNEAALLRRADIVFYGARTLMDERPAFQEKSHHFPTGVDVQHFARAAGGGVPVPSDIRAIRGPILGYWGAVDNRIDFALLRHAATACPEWAFVLLGPLVALRREAISDFLSLPNVHWLGPKHYKDIPEYARQFDICLLPFKTGDEGRYLNPTKTLEYLATGKPVLSTRIPDVERFYSDTVEIVQTPQEFIATARQLLEHDADATRARRLEEAHGRSWEAMAGGMWALIEQRMQRATTPCE